MRNRFKNKDKVFVYGTGKNAGVFYRNVPAIIIERDSFYKDYLVKFNNKGDYTKCEIDSKTRIRFLYMALVKMLAFFIEMYQLLLLKEILFIRII